jgi:hypothetical protein
MKRGLAGAVRAVAMARKTAMVSKDEDNHDNCDNSDNDDDRPQRAKRYLKLRCAAEHTSHRISRRHLQDASTILS